MSGSAVEAMARTAQAGFWRSSARPIPWDNISEVAREDWRNVARALLSRGPVKELVEKAARIFEIEIRMTEADKAALTADDWDTAYSDFGAALAPFLPAKETHAAETYGGGRE